MNSPGKIQAVTLDAGGTLIGPWPSVGDIYAEVAARHGISGEAGNLNRQFAQAWRAKSNFDHSQAAWFDLVEKTFAGHVTVTREFFGDLYDRFGRADAWSVYPDVLPALDSLLNRGLRLGIVSNWDERLRPLISELKLDRYFDAVVVSCEVGFAKPSPVIFEQACRKLGVPPEECLHIGDTLTDDVEGAAAVKMPSLLLARGALPAKDRISTLLEIESRIASGQL